MSDRSAYKWLRRFREEGLAGLADRRSRPHRSPRRIGGSLVGEILRLRRRRWFLEPIARELRTSASTVARVARRAGLSRLAALDPVEPANRYEWERPGDLVHLDTKKLGRIDGVGHRITGNRRHRPRAGWEYLHVCIDDHSRLAYAEILAAEDAVHAMGFLQRAIAWFGRIGVNVKRALTDNGSCYVSKAFAALCLERNISHRRTRPYRPRTNGKAERLIQTLLREWAYRFAYQSSEHRRNNLSRYLAFYNARREHTSLGKRPPVSRLDMNNLLAIHN